MYLRFSTTRMLALAANLLIISWGDGRNCECRSKKSGTLGSSPKFPTQYAPVETPVISSAKDEAKDEANLVTKDEDNPSLNVEPEHDGGKNVEILNSCSFDVELGFTGSDKGPSNNGVCPENQSDNGHGRCFWSLKNLPRALKSGASFDVNLDSNAEHLFSGNVWGTKSGLMQSICPMGRCDPWVGPRGSLTKAEFTFSKSGIDYFDTSIIEGANIPIAMYPLNVKPDPNDRYMCGVAGGCSWDFDPEPDLKKYVTQVLPKDASSKKCEQDSECRSGEICGATFDVSPPNYGVCGVFNGYASAHVSCMARSTGAPFFCEDNNDVISCMDEYSLSGYNQPPGTKVCGCVDWLEMGIDAPTHVPCETTDKNWEEKSLPFLKFLKRGCPLNYVWAYDDQTSIVTCASTAYTIEFCPKDSEKNFFKY